MEPSLLVGDHVLVNKFVHSWGDSWLEQRLLPKRPVRPNDVVVFRLPGDPTRDLVKRCVANSRDRVRIQDKSLMIDGLAAAEPWVVHRDEHVYPPSRFLQDDLRYRDNYGPITVPDGRLFCLGDNRDYSRDSRFWGTVPLRNVRGRAFLIYWSEARHGPEEPDGGQSQRWTRSLRLIR